jgi:hypothetical protein
MVPPTALLMTSFMILFTALPIITPIISATTLPIILYLYILILLLSIIWVPLFEGANATEFLNHFEDLCKEYSVSDEDKLFKLPCYYS